MAIKQYAHFQYYSTNTSVIIDTVFYKYNFYISSKFILENESRNTEKIRKYEA